jgi:Fe-S-cluster-containing hydrogenase component 2
MCPVSAIDFSAMASGRLLSGDAMLVKKSCISCSLCERVCIYDGVVHGDNGPHPKTSHAIDMKKCTYPKCQLCLDNCPMNAIDFSYNPPLFHHDCEGCDMCWCVCPTGAVSIPNLAVTQAAMANRGPRNMPGGAQGKASGGLPGAMNGGQVGDSAAFDPVNIAKRAQGVSHSSSPFRRLVPLDKIGYDHIIMDNPNTPRIIVDPENGNTNYCESPCKV